MAYGSKAASAFLGTPEALLRLLRELDNKVMARSPKAVLSSFGKVYRNGLWV